MTFTMIKSRVPTAMFALAACPGTAAIQPLSIGARDYRITNPAIRNA